MSADNTLSLKARHWQNGRASDEAAGEHGPKRPSRGHASKPEGAPERPLESDEFVLRTSQVSRDDHASGALDEGVATLAQDLHLTVERDDHVEHLRQTPDGVEQSWEFPARPAGRGDLVVRVTTSGLKYAGETAAGLHFADTRGLGFGYGHGTWIDATGAKTAVSARYHDGAVELAVPAELVERSVYPALLDPIVGPEFAMDAVYGPGYVSRHEFTPDVASNGEGYLVAWQDRRSGNSYDIYATRVSAAGMVLDGAGIALTNTTGDESRPKVASNGSDYLVVWQRGTAGNTDIHARRVSAGGALEDDANIVVVNTTAGQRNPSVASNGSGYLVVWEDDRSTADDIRARSVSAAGVLGTDTAVSSAANDQSYPTVASNGSDYLVAWQDDRGANTDVYASRVNALGAVVDAAGIAVSTVQGNQIYPSLASDGTDYLIAWQDYRFGSASDVYASRVNAAGSILDPTGIAVSWATDSQFNPRVASNGSDYLVAWSQSGVGGLDIYATRVTSSGVVPAGAETAVSAATGNQSVPSVASDGSDYLVAWQDARAGTYNDIYASRLTAAGVVQDSAGFRVSTEASSQFGPSVASNGDGFLVAWEDYRSGSSFDIYANRVSPDGTLLDGAGLLVSSASNNQLSPSAGTNGTDYFLVWQDLRGGINYDIYGSRVTASGVVQDPGGVLVSGAADSQLAPGVASNGDGYLVVWEDWRSGSTNKDIYASRVTPLAVVQDGATGLPVSTAAGSQSAPSVASNGTDYLVAWHDLRAASTNNDIYASRVTTQGSVLDSAGLPVSTAPYEQQFPSVASDGTDYLVVWEDRRSGNTYDVYASRVSALGSVLDPSGVVVSVNFNTQARASVASNGSGYVVVWMDTRSGRTDADLYGATLAWNPTAEVSEFVIDTDLEETNAVNLVSDGTRYLLAYVDHDGFIPRIHQRFIENSCAPANDADGDGICTGDNCPNVANPGQQNSDADLAGDACDGCPNDAQKTATGTCGCGVADTDSDGDGAPDCDDECSGDSSKVVPGICGCGTPDTNTDGDAAADCNDACDNDPLKIAEGPCGCGTPDTNTDGDSAPDCNDACDDDPLKVAVGKCGCGTPDTDSDGDGTPNCNDTCPSNPNKLVPGVCGCSLTDADSDADGMLDCQDPCPLDSQNDCVPVSEGGAGGEGGAPADGGTSSTGGTGAGSGGRQSTGGSQAIGGSGQATGGAAAGGAAAGGAQALGGAGPSTGGTLPDVSGGASGAADSAEDTSGCGCRVVGQSTGSPASTLVLLAGLGLIVMRRRLRAA